MFCQLEADVGHSQRPYGNQKILLHPVVSSPGAGANHGSWTVRQRQWTFLLCTRTHLHFSNSNLDSSMELWNVVKGLEIPDTVLRKNLVMRPGNM